MNVRVACSLAALLVALVSFSACNRVKPEQPAAAQFDAPLGAGPSYIGSPIVFEVAELEERVNQALGRVIVEGDVVKMRKGRDLYLKIERSGSVRLRVDGQRVTFGAPLVIWLENPVSLRRNKTPRQPLCSLDVEFNSPISVSDDWRLSTRVSLNRFKWITPPKMKVLGIPISVKKIAENILDKRRGEIEKAIDLAIHQELRLDREIRKLWVDLQKPLLINRRYENIWLVPKPNAVQVGEIYGNRGVIVIPIRIRLQIDSYFGDKPDVALNKQLPRLQKVKAISYNCHLNLLSRIQYEDLNSALKQTLDGRNLELMKGLVKIKDANVYGSGSSLILRTDVGGKVRGVLYFRGRPAFDTVNHALSIHDFDFDVRTEEVLLSSADWLLHDNLKDTLQTALHLPLKSHLDSLPQKIETAFARGRPGKRARLDIRSFRLVPRTVAVRPEAIQVLIHADATVNLRITDL